MTRSLRRRPALAALVALIVPAALGVAACSGPETTDPQAGTAGRGQTLSELTTALDDIEGLTFSDVGGSEPNVKGNTGFTVRVALDPAYELVDPAALVDFLVEAAWSVDDSPMPNTTVEIAYLGIPGDDVDLGAAAQQSGWLAPEARTRQVAANGYSRATVPVADYAVDQGVPETVDRLGPWPGPVPAVPEDLTAPREG
jgi:hypothetical protein